MSSGALNGSGSEAQRATRQAARLLLGLSVGFRWVIVSSSDEVLWTGRCVNSVEQHQALRHLKWVASDRSLHGSCVPTVPSSHESSTFDTCNAFSASGNEIQQIKKAA